MVDQTAQKKPAGVICNGVVAVSLLRELTVRKAVGGIGKTTLWRWVRDGHFPKPVRLGANCVAWRADDVNQWINSRPAFDDEEV